ncbi:unnamed protein product [Hanseniaspora opuntiae]
MTTDIIPVLSMSKIYTNKQKLTQVICAIVWCLLGSGVIFGFASIKPILIKEGIYSSLCSPEDGLPFGKACDNQDLKLNKLFSYGAAMTNLTSLIVGSLLDSYGPKFCGYIGCCLITLGSIILSYNQPLYQYFDSYIVGYVTLAVGGPFVFISCFQLANTFPKYSGTILALISGAFDTSSAVFLFYRLAYEHGFSNINLHVFFNYYLVVPLFIFICQWKIMPTHSYKNNGSESKEDTLGDIQKLAIEGLDGNGELPVGSIASRTGATEDLENMDGADEIDALLDNQSVISSKTLSNRRKSKIEIITEQQLYKKSKGINDIFDIALPLGGVIAIPLIGLLLDNINTLYVLYILFFTSITVGVLGLVKNSFIASTVGIILLTMYRPFYYTVVSDYCSKVFGFETFGTVYGLLMTLAGLCNLAQNKLDYWTHFVFNKNPVPINFILTSLTVVSGISLLAYINIKISKPHSGELLKSTYGSY